MSLKTRIFLGYAFFVVLIALSTLGAALGFHQLGSTLGRMLGENLTSVRAATRMLQALERIEVQLSDQPAGADAAAAFAAPDAAFRLALEDARRHVTVEGEDAIVNDIGDGFAAYRAARERQLADGGATPARVAEVQARFAAVRERVIELVEINRQAIIDADRRIQDLTTRRALMHGLVLALALTSLGFIARAMRRDVLDRLAELDEVAAAVGAGDRSRRAGERPADELGRVARQLNAALDREQRVEAAMSGRLAHQRQLLVGVLNAQEPRGVLLTLDGRVIASGLSDEDTDAVADLSAQLPPVDERDTTVPPEVVLAVAGHRVRLRLLRAGHARPVGWLATLG